jgi:ApbE family
MDFSLLKLKPRLYPLLIVVGTLSLANCTKPPTEALLSGDAQGTTYHIKFVLDNDKPNQLVDIQKLITTALADIDLKLSNYRKDSEISRINQNETTEWLAASQEIIGLLIISQSVFAKSGGCFDLTIKPLFDLWGFSKHEPSIPKQADIDAMLPHIGMDMLEIDAKQHRLRKKDPQLKIDLASIAQGYSVGRVGELLETGYYCPSPRKGKISNAYKNPSNPTYKPLPTPIRVFRLTGSPPGGDRVKVKSTKTVVPLAHNSFNSKLCNIFGNRIFRIITSTGWVEVRQTLY